MFGGYKMNKYNWRQWIQIWIVVLGCQERIPEHPDEFRLFYEGEPLNVTETNWALDIKN